MLYCFGENTAEDVARFVELGKLTPEQYEWITGEKYGASVVEQHAKVQ
ncbi:XkdX family protein [Brevibacillus porteri]